MLKYLIFDYAAVLNCNPQECLFVDDNQTNVEVARNVGMNAILFAGFEEFAHEFEWYESE